MTKYSKKAIKESKLLWEMEKITVDNSPDPANNYKELINAIDPLIQSGKILYSDFIDAVHTFFFKHSKEVDATLEDDTEERKKVVDNTFKDVINYFNNLR